MEVLTFPTVSYRYLLHRLFDRDTVVGSIQDPCPNTSDVLRLYQQLLPKELLHTSSP